MGIEPATVALQSHLCAPAPRRLLACIININFFYVRFLSPYLVFQSDTTDIFKLYTIIYEVININVYYFVSGITVFSGRRRFDGNVRHIMGKLSFVN